MSSNIFPRTRTQQQQQRAAASQALTPRQSIRTGPPWQGYTPDLPEGELPYNFARNTRGLVARSAGGGGEVLALDAGWARAENTTPSQPLGNDADSSHIIVRLDEFAMVDDATGAPAGNESTKGIAIVAGDGTNAGSCEMFELTPGTGDWTEIPYAGGAAPAGGEPAGNRDGDSLASDALKSMPDSCTFHGGATARTAYNGNIDHPAFVWTNNIDPVMVYPVLETTLKFEPLTDQLGDGEAEDYDFRCVSVETFGERVYFLNTFENQVRHRNRLRRTARGTADPDPALLGAGFIDLDNFSGNGLRVEQLGNVLACYFQDGTAFVRETGLVTEPNSVQILDTPRGLLSTHSVCSVGENRHFGIFFDGWWLLDSSGRWQEVGIIGDGSQANKWKDTFYDRLDETNLQRLQVYYDEERHYVRISFPTQSDDLLQEHWIYDLHSDRVWPQIYPDTQQTGGGATCWGRITLRDTDALVWDDANFVWNLALFSWDSVSPPVGNRRLVHGNTNGYIFYHTNGLATQDGELVDWAYESVRSHLGNPDTLKTIDQVTIEHVDSESGESITISAYDGRGGETAGTLGASEGTSSAIISASQSMRLSSEHLGVRLSGSGQIYLRRFMVDYFSPGSRRHT